MANPVVQPSPVHRVHWSPVLVALAAIGAASLLLITLSFPGATRMYAWPWSLAYWTVLAAPAGILLARVFDRSHPLKLPSPGWTIAAVAAAIVILASALFSPYRGSPILWSAPLLAPIAGFLVFSDALQTNDAHRDSRARAWAVWLALGFIIAATSIVQWLSATTHSSWAVSRNAYPLGHSNYTAGLALLILPGFGAQAFCARGAKRAFGFLGALLACVMVFTSASRAAVFGLAVLAIAGIVLAPVTRRVRTWIALGAIAATFAVTGLHPRTRAMLQPTKADAIPNISNVQRSAMLHAGLRMGADRPLLGFGPGTTPLAFPRYRAGLEGGAENVLQLHSLPVQLWGELGVAGLACALLFGALAVRSAARDRLAAVTLGSYGVFSVFDAQIDVPIFGFGLALLLASLAVPKEPAVIRDNPRGRLGIGVLTVVSMVAIALLGHRDLAPQLNAEALRPDIARRKPEIAIGLLRQSLRLNADQEIAHFNLGWLLVVRDPTAAAHHFSAAARLVPDKGGVYFGLGLARRNAGDAAGAARAFALESLNDPLFLLSPWWDNSELAPLSRPTLAFLADYEARLVEKIAPHGRLAREMRYVQALNAWVAGNATAANVAAVATTAERRRFFDGNPGPGILRAAGYRTRQNERIGYPVLMRNLDLPPPVDLWEIQESAIRNGQLEYLWPDKGWLPSYLMIALLDDDDSPKK